MKIAIVGGGPAGGALAWHLARAGVSATVLDDSHPREKPCGGGVTQRGWEAFALLADLDLPHLDVSRSVYVPAAGKPTLVPGHPPIRIYSRKDLDLAVLQAAVNAGARWEKKRVREIAKDGGGWNVDGERYDLVVGADGTNGVTRRTLARPFEKGDRLLCVGYFVPGEFPDEVWVEFFPGFFGYAWFFPRGDHVSVGIGAMEGAADKKELYERIHLFLARRFPEVKLDGATTYGGVAPCVKDGRLEEYGCAGEGWALVGDAAGFCDPMTGEGLFYAYASADLLAQSIGDAGDPAGAVENYRAAVRRELLPELDKSSTFLNRFYQDWFINTAMFMIRHSRSAKGLAARYIAGHQGLLDIKRNVLRMTPRVFYEIAAGRKE